MTNVKFLTFTDAEFESYIDGPYVKKLWDRYTSLMDFKDCIPDLEDSELVKIYWMSKDTILEDSHLHSTVFRQACIRDEDVATNESRVATLRGSFIRSGWSPNPEESMPIVASDGPGTPLEFQEGRGRVQANIEGETPQGWIPVAEFRKNNLIRDSLTNSLRYGFLTNIVDKPKTGAKMDDYVPALMKAIKAGVVNENLEDVKKYLINELLFSKVFPHTASATKTAKKALKRKSESEFVLERMELDDVKVWGSRNPKIKNLSGKVFYIRSNSRKALNSALEEILHYLLNNPYEHVNIVFYTTEIVYSKAKEEVQKAQKRVDDWWNNFHKVAFASFFSGSNLVVIPEARYTILGCVPQFVLKHDINGNSLVPIKQY